MTPNPNATRPPSRLARACRALALTAIAAAGTLLSASPAAAEDWHVSGRVTYSDGSAVPGATVTLRIPSGAETSVQTNALGYYQLTAADPGATGSALLWSSQGSCTSQPQSVIDRDITQGLTLPGSAGSC